MAWGRYKSENGIAVVDGPGESTHVSQNALQGAYATAFQTTELPFGGSAWKHGYSDGGLWNNIRSTPGKAFGTQVNLGPVYMDGIAHLVGVWGNDQSATAACVTTNRLSPSDSNGSNSQEVEILLRFSIDQGRAVGYEVTFSVDPNSPFGKYVQVNRWNGGSGAFTLLASAASITINNGSTLFASIIGTTITVKVDGTTVITYDTVSDTPKYASGAPGVGHYYMNPAGTGTYAASDFGLSSFSVTAA